MATYLDIEVSLDDIEPRIWRRFLRRERASFLDLHHAIQSACGWEDAHLFAFRDDRGGTVAGIADDFGFGDPDPDAAKVKAAPYLKRHERVTYEYDFGDSWVHTVELKGVVQEDSRDTRRLLAGARAFPPEDCGGVPGYEDILRVFAGQHALYHDTDILQTWKGVWNPEHFDLEAVRADFDC